MNINIIFTVTRKKKRINFNSVHTLLYLFFRCSSFLRHLRKIRRKSRSQNEMRSKTRHSKIGEKFEWKQLNKECFFKTIKNFNLAKRQKQNKTKHSKIGEKIRMK